MEINVKYEVLKAVYEFYEPVSIIYLRDNPLFMMMDMSDDALCHNLRHYYKQGLLKRHGKGGKGDPYRWELTEKGEERMRYFEN